MTAHRLRPAFPGHDRHRGAGDGVLAGVPIWRIDLMAPQYPEGLFLQIFHDRFTGDVDKINGLNHYIGMATIENAMFPEFAIMRYAFYLLIGWGLLAAAIGRRAALFTWLIGLFAFVIWAMWDMYAWGYKYGHDLDPRAAIKVEGMAYQPPLLRPQEAVELRCVVVARHRWLDPLRRDRHRLVVWFMEWRWPEERDRSPPDRCHAPPVVGPGLVLLPCLFASCGSRGPPAIDFGKAECAYCRMNVMDQQFASAIVTRQGRTYAFDSPECMVQHVAEGAIAEDQVAGGGCAITRIRARLIDATKAFYLRIPRPEEPHERQRGGLRQRPTAPPQQRIRAKLDWSARKAPAHRTMLRAPTVLPALLRLQRTRCACPGGAGRWHHHASPGHDRGLRYGAGACRHLPRGHHHHRTAGGAAGRRLAHDRWRRQGRGAGEGIACDHPGLRGARHRHQRHERQCRDQCISVTDILIIGNRVEACFFGIYLSSVARAMVSDNRVIGDATTQENRRANGIHLWKCSHVDVLRNTAMHHRDGIYLEFVTDSRVSYDTTAFNMRYGLHFMFSHRDSYTHNLFHDNGAGVAVMFTHEVTMTDNRFLRNRGASAYGLLLKEINDARIERNTFAENTVGILMDGCNRATVIDNLFDANGWAVKLFANSTATRFEGNHFSGNTFDMTTNGDLVMTTLTGQLLGPLPGLRPGPGRQRMCPTVR
ncbi:MAG: right-handed parallel beta-helix repeat-containing protein [Flavobacteriales bacterium]|nr:right-handed parallel beta-helix repeat-containing protein [Flavobacteriales bacterium]